MKINVPLKPPEYRRNKLGQFERPGATLGKGKATNKELANIGQFKPGVDARRAPGRPPGSPNKTTLKLKEMILAALDKVGGEQYLATLAVENSSAFSSLLAKILPSQLAADVNSDGGAGLEVRFVREIFYPGGRTEIEGVTPKQLPAPASPVLPSDASSTQHARDTDDKDVARRQRTSTPSGSAIKRGVLGTPGRRNHRYLV